MMKVAALILAKGNSRRVHNKNTRLCGGKKLVEWPLSAAMESEVIDDVFVSTDGAEIKEIALEYGAYVIDRPAQLATSTAGGAPTQTHALKKIFDTGFRYDYMFSMWATSPMIQAWQLDEAFHKFIDSRYATNLSTVTSIKPTALTNIYIHDPGDNRLMNTFGQMGPPPYFGLLPFVKTNGGFGIYNPNLADYAKLIDITPETEYAEILADYASVAASYKRADIADNSYTTYGYIIDRISAHDIDTEDDLALADYFLRMRAKDEALKKEFLKKEKDKEDKQKCLK